MGASGEEWPREMVVVVDDAQIRSQPSSVLQCNQPSSPAGKLMHGGQLDFTKLPNLRVVSRKGLSRNEAKKISGEGVQIGGPAGGLENVKSATAVGTRRRREAEELAGCSRRSTFLWRGSDVHAIFGFHLTRLLYLSIQEQLSLNLEPIQTSPILHRRRRHSTRQKRQTIAAHSKAPRNPLHVKVSAQKIWPFEIANTATPCLASSIILVTCRMFISKPGLDHASRKVSTCTGIHNCFHSTIQLLCPVHVCFWTSTNTIARVCTLLVVHATRCLSSP